MKSALALTDSFSTPNFSSVARKMLRITVSLLGRHKYTNGRTDDRCPDARGHYTIGKELVDDVIDRIRRVAGKIIYWQVVEGRKLTML
jgi:hypothetical protein